MSTQASDIIPGIVAEIFVEQMKLSGRAGLDGLSEFPNEMAHRILSDEELDRVILAIRDDDGSRPWFIYKDPDTYETDLIRLDRRPCNKPAMALALAAEFEEKAAELLSWAESLRDAGAVLALVD